MLGNKKIKIPRTFSKTRKKQMNMSRLCFTANQVNKLRYDCILVGSDEVWNFKDKKSNNPIKFGIGLNCRKLIAYAPSVGKSKYSDELPDYVIEGLKKFKSISARDDLTFELATKVVGEEPTRVLDPTFLHNFPIEKSKIPNKPYILFYYCDDLPISIKDQILKYAYDNDLYVYGAGECDKQYSSVTVNLNPFEWVDMFRNAEYVFTGTFHGAVFSILNNRQFSVYLTNESRIRKVRALLKELKIENREINEEFTFNLHSKDNLINYSEVNEIVNKRRNESLEYLRENIDYK